MVKAFLFSIGIKKIIQQPNLKSPTTKEFKAAKFHGKISSDEFATIRGFA